MVHGSQFTVHDSQFTVHGSRFRHRGEKQGRGGGEGELEARQI